MRVMKTRTVAQRSTTRPGNPFQVLNGDFGEDGVEIIDETDELMDTDTGQDDTGGASHPHQTV